ncbi:MAG: glycosyltransferase family 4 protein [Pseudomonadales bacterium]
MSDSSRIEYLSTARGGNILTDVVISQEARWERLTKRIPQQRFGGIIGSVFHSVRIVACSNDADTLITGNVRVAALLGMLKAIHPKWNPRLISLETRFDDPRPGILWALKLYFQRVAFAEFDVVCVSARREIGIYSERLRLPDGKIRFVPWHTNIVEPKIIPTRGNYVFSAGRTGRDWKTLSLAAKKCRNTRFVVVMTESDRAQVCFPENVEVFVDVPYERYRELLEDARIVVVPLRVHAYSSGQVALLEAMALGKPIICTKVLGTEDYIKDGVDGLLVDPDDVDSMVRAIELVGDVSTAEKLSKSALETVLGSHTFSKYVGAILEYAKE